MSRRGAFQISLTRYNCPSPLGTRETTISQPRQLIWVYE